MEGNVSEGWKIQIFLVIKVLTQIKRKGYLWNTSQTLERSQRRKSEESDTVTKGRKHKKAHQATLPKLQKERAEVMKNEVAENFTGGEGEATT